MAKAGALKGLAGLRLVAWWSNGRRPGRGRLRGEKTSLGPSPGQTLTAGSPVPARARGPSLCMTPRTRQPGRAFCRKHADGSRTNTNVCSRVGTSSAEGKDSTMGDAREGVREPKHPLSMHVSVFTIDKFSVHFCRELLRQHSSLEFNERRAQLFHIASDRLSTC